MHALRKIPSGLGKPKRSVSITFEVFQTSKVLNARVPEKTFGLGKTPKVITFEVYFLF